MSAALLTTKDVAELLRVHPKHVYRLLRSGLPARRVGGEWRFDRDEVLRWSQDRGRAGAIAPPSVEARPPLIAANGDLVIEVLLEQIAAAGPPIGFVLADRDQALSLLERSMVLAAGCHGAGPPGELGGHRMARVHLVERQIGLAAAKDQRPPALSTLKGKRLALRPPSAGVRRHFDRALADAKIPAAALVARATLYRSHRDVALAIAAGEAEVGLLSAAWAQRLGLPFFPIATEPYGLILHASDLGDPRVVRLCEAAQSATLRRRLGAIAGYDPADAGAIRYDPDNQRAISSAASAFPASVK